MATTETTTDSATEEDTVTVDVSAREAEVLALLGEHLSNAEIGARLYISVRTVESHVSALLRKLGAPDRRTLARRAAAVGRPAVGLPRPPTSFVGRVEERAGLAAALDDHRLVTAVGPGGVGKTRLALAVATDVTERFPDGIWFVDLAPTTDPGMVPAVVAAAVGLGEQTGADLADTVASALTDRRILLVLDNCEHVLDGVAPFVERLLTDCPAVTVLATSRARLMVPFERVHPVPPLSLSAERPDAVALFHDRAASGGQPPESAEWDRIRTFCERLDGMALAIELAAARWSTLGPDGLDAALADPLRMLTGGSRTADRHRSVRAALDWSHDLLTPDERRLLRRVSVFSAPFDVTAATAVVDAGPAEVADGLARLAEQSLLTVSGGRDGTRYRALETIRQYGAERMIAAGEETGIRTRHLRWCLRAAVDLATPGDLDGSDWRVRFDAVADDLRSALGWAADCPDHRTDAHRLAAELARLAFTRNLVGESQQRYEQAAELADDPAVAATMRRHAAAVAGCRTRGDDLYRLLLAAGDTALRAGDRVGAAVDLATAATSAYRFSTKFERLPGTAEAIALLDRARELAGTDPAAAAAIALAEAGILADAFGAAQGPADNDVTDTLARAERAVMLAERTGDPFAQSAALDALTGSLSWSGDPFAAAATARRRIELLAVVPDGPARSHELVDALSNATEAALGAGDLAAARTWARRLAEHPMLAEVGHRATSWQLVHDALTGDVGEVVTRGARFLDAWQRAGSPARFALGPAVAGVAMLHGLRGDPDERSRWLAVLDRLGTPPERVHGYEAVFDAILMLHNGQHGSAMDRLAAEPESVWKWITWIWWHWYVALRAEAAVLAGAVDAGVRLDRARSVVAGNPVAETIVARADALARGDGPALPAIAERFHRIGSDYQAARTRWLAGGAETRRGAADLAALGVVVPPTD